MNDEERDLTEESGDAAADEAISLSDTEEVFGTPMPLAQEIAGAEAAGDDEATAEMLFGAPPVEVADIPDNPATVTELAVAEPVTELVIPPAPLTMAELLAEEYPQGAPTRLAGAMVNALQRELRRRNRKAEKGY